MLRLALLLALAATARALRVVVAGATGKVGRELVRVLKRQGVEHAALTRDVLAAKRLLGVATKCVEVDLDDEARVDAALDGEGPFRLYAACANGPNQAAQEARLYAAAARTGRCEHVVKVSTCAAFFEADAGPAAAHAEAEAALRDSSSSWTILRPSVFVESLTAPSPLLGLPGLESGAAAHALADEKIAMISTRDVAAVAARRLVAAAPPANATLHLSGPAVTTLAAVAASCDVSVDPQPVDAHLGGLPPPVAESMRSIFAALASEAAAAVTPDAERALGEPPRAAADVLRRDLAKRRLDSGDAPEAYNGRGVWSANYRKQLTFDECRKKARLMGHRCEADWREVGVPKYSPSRPDDMFPDEWLGWDDFLGVRRPYEDARKLARTLGVRSELAWSAYAVSFAPVLADLRLPARPSLAYGDAFRGWDDWLGLEDG